MNKIERIKKYISRTKQPNSRYSINTSEILDMIAMSSENPFDTITLAFDYGRAKGYRAAKAEMRNE